jgi:hypothetical protein
MMEVVDVSYSPFNEFKFIFRFIFERYAALEAFTATFPAVSNVLEAFTASLFPKTEGTRQAKPRRPVPELR